MKKSLFSLLILSTLSLSTQAIAQQINLGNQNIAIQGRVIQDDLTCNVEPIAPIQLQNAYISSFERTPKKQFNVDFTGCSNVDKPKKVKIVIARQNATHLMNAGTTENDTNARVALFNSAGKLVPLNGEQEQRTFYSDVAGDNGSLAFSLKYDKPEGDNEVTAGNFAAVLGLNAYVTDDIIDNAGEGGKDGGDAQDGEG